MQLHPTSLDTWIVATLAGFLGRSPLFDKGIQSAAIHHVLGGLWYALAIYLLWVQGTAQNNARMRLRILTTLVGSLAAILLIFPASAVIQWPPPLLNPTLSHLYPNYIYGTPDPNSFPSRGAVLYAAVAAGVFSLDKVKGTLLWLGMVFLIGFPRIYLGGHYPTDVLAGIVLGLAGYLFARHLLEPRLLPRIAPAIKTSGWLDGLQEAVVFVWILQVAVEFQDVIWIGNIFGYFMRR